MAAEASPPFCAGQLVRLLDCAARLCQCHMGALGDDRSALLKMKR